MKITFNSKTIDINSESNLLEIISTQYDKTNGVAVAVNNSVIPKDKWISTPISEGDDIVLIKAVCGG
jgi:sulfur carrier protein